LLLRILIPLSRRWFPSLLCILAAFIVARALIYRSGGDIQFYAYTTIIGRFDQFVLGVVAWRFRRCLTGRHGSMVILTIGFFAFYHWFAAAGGYYGPLRTQGVWVYLPTIEAAYFSALVGYYATTFRFARTAWWRLVESAGAASYSIYLLHTFFVFAVAKATAERFPWMGTWEFAEAVALIAFVGMASLAWLSYRWIELPFLGLRKPYFAERGARRAEAAREA
jgi:peptidoglycan/LPS O-acetylase OafA/YrhL